MLLSLMMWVLGDCRWGHCSICFVVFSRAYFCSCLFGRLQVLYVDCVYLCSELVECNCEEACEIDWKLL